eukprot:SAG11_NODE_41251_length_196_cov_38.979381_1_plen_49_part_01
MYRFSYHETLPWEPGGRDDDDDEDEDEENKDDDDVENEEGEHAKALDAE